MKLGFARHRILVWLAAGLSLSFLLGSLSLRFGVEYYTLPSGRLPHDALGRESRVSARGKTLVIRTINQGGTGGCVAIFPGQHGPSSEHEAALVPELTKRGVELDLIGYPGQTKDDEQASLQEIAALSRKALQEISVRCKPQKLVVLGRSFGAMAATYAARGLRPAGLLLEGASPRLSTSIRNRLRSRIFLRPLLWLPVEHLLVEDYTLARAIPEVGARQVRIFQGTADEATPIEDLRAPEALPEGVELISVVGGTHSNAFAVALPQYVDTILQMLNPTLPRP